jgi:hypothetical protein
VHSVGWTEIEGGWTAFESAYTRGALFAVIKQTRFADHLNTLGTPGSARWDPLLAEVELRGHVFRAEQIGSFDGQTWLWAWANHHLQIPDRKTTCARRLRDVVGPQLGTGAIGTPLIVAPDERIPYLMGSVALASLDVEGYYVANQSQVYAVLPGQVPSPSTGALTELRRATCALMNEPAMPQDLPAALRFASDQLGLSVRETDQDVTATDGRGEVAVEKSPVPWKRLAVAFLREPIDLDQATQWLAGGKNAPALEREGEAAVAGGNGWQLRVRVATALRIVMAEANALPSNADQARGRRTVVTVETFTRPSLRGSLVPYLGTWAPAAIMREPVGHVAPEALRVVERLSAHPGALVYDTYLRRFSPEPPP